MYLADDLSYDDLGFHGNTEVATPNVDRFAKESVQFTHMYTPTAMCTPARAVLFTGRYPVQNGAYMNHGKVAFKVKMLPYYLAPLGYHFLLLGKDHVGLQSRVNKIQYNESAYTKDDPLGVLKDVMQNVPDVRCDNIVCLPDARASVSLDRKRGRG